MKICVSRIVPTKRFDVVGMSYIGNPRSNTAMFITKKVEGLLSGLDNVENCLVFAENGMNIPQNMIDKHAFSFSDTPQLNYARFAAEFSQARFDEEKQLRFILKEDGYYVSEDVEIPGDAYIESGCQIGPGVSIGSNAKIFKGCVIRHSIIGNDFVANEYAVIGSNGFTMTDDEYGNKIRIPTLGRVIIGDNVEVGAHDNISCGSGGDTIIEDNVKIDALVHIGHDDCLKKNCELAAGTILGGFVTVGEGTFVGINTTVKNRIEVGSNTFVSMASAVMKPVSSSSRVIGNPARPLPKE